MISVVVLTKNEEKNIKKCLDSLNWCDEIIVIDDFSQDKTVEIAKKMGVRVFTHSLDDNYAHQRNFSLKKAKENWVLFVDADERISTALAAEIQETTKRPNNQTTKGFYLRRKDFVFGKWLKYGETTKIKLLRLAKRDAGQWQRAVHEVWKIRGKTGQLENPLLHYPHPTVSQFLEKIGEYSTIRAKELCNQGIKTNFGEIIAYPAAKFFKNFVWHLGFLDGLPGFLHAVMMSFHSFLVRGKLWLLYHKKDKT